MGRKQLLKRERHGQLRIDWEPANNLEDRQLALLPNVEPYWLNNPKASVKKFSRPAEKDTFLS